MDDVLAAPEAELERLVRAEQSRYPVPGASIGIVDGDDEKTVAFGVTNVDHPLVVTADTFFQIGSITKTYLATLIMRLVDERELELDAPVRRWLPGFRVRDETTASNVTLRHLLTHTAGWFGDHFGDFGWNDDALERYVASMSDLEQQVPLGTEFAYNNAAFSVAGRVVEVVTRRPIELAMHELLFMPLGLKDTFFFANDVITRRVAVGHHVVGSIAEVARPWPLPRHDNCRGGIVASVRDLLAYARFHMGDGTTSAGDRYLSRRSAELMASPLVRAALGQSRGIAWSVEDLNGVRVVSHSGGTIGQQAFLWLAPAKRVAVAVLANSSQATQLQQAVVRWSWEHYLGFRRKPSPPMSFDDELADRASGTYRNPAAELRVVREGRLLMLYQQPLAASFRQLMQNPPPAPDPVRVAFSRVDRLVLLAGPLQGREIEVLGRNWIRFGARLYQKVA